MTTVERETQVRDSRAHGTRDLREFQSTEVCRVVGHSQADRSSLGDKMAMGELMYASHDSYSACGLGSQGTDLLVELVRSRSRAGTLWAKITGGGSGGTVAVLEIAMRNQWCSTWPIAMRR